MLGGFLTATFTASYLVGRTRPIGDIVTDSPVFHAAMDQPAPIGGYVNGDLSMLLFTDYNCAACRLTHAPMMQAVREDGAVRIHYLDWPIMGEDSKEAARVTLAAHKQALYEPMHQKLMQGPRANRAHALELFQQLGGNLDGLLADLGARASEIEGQFSRNAIHAMALGLGGTPGHVIGHVRLRGMHNSRDFHRAFARARKLAHD